MKKKWLFVYWEIMWSGFNQGVKGWSWDDSYLIDSYHVNQTRAFVWIIIFPYGNWEWPYEEVYIFHFIKECVKSDLFVY